MSYTVNKYGLAEFEPGTHPRQLRKAREQGKVEDRGSAEPEVSEEAPKTVTKGKGKGKK